jgi:peptide/nickel transport system permease protein
MAAPETSETQEPEDLVPSGPGGEATDSPGIEPTAKPSRKGKLGFGGWLAAAWILTVVAVAIFAPLLPIDDPARQQYRPGMGWFDDGHPFGTDQNGRDVFARVLWGSRVSLMIGVGAVLIGMVVGGALGLYAGYFRNRAASAISWAFDALLAFPALVLALALVAVLAPGGEATDLRRNMVIVIALGIVAIPLLGRITRGATLAWSQREFVLAARSLGARDLRIMVREVLPNVLPAMFSIALLSVAVAVVAEGGLAVLGAGTQSISWGSVIANNPGGVQRTPHVILAPSMFLFLTVLAINYVGDIVRARFDVRESLL